MDREMLERWSAKLDERRRLQEFWEFVCERARARIDPDLRDDVELCEIHIEAELDAFHEIDHRQLEIERRALIDSIGGGG